MAAFVAFVRTFAVWIYLLCGLGVLVAIKMFVDAQRLSRTTLFSLEQERASEQTYRALMVLAVFFIAIIFFTLVNLVLAPVVPTSDQVILRGPTATLAPLVIPTNTRVLTSTFTPIRPTETPVEANPPAGVTPTRAAKPSVVIPPVSPSAVPVYALPAPKIVGPIPNGVVVTGFERARNDLSFQWTWDCAQCKLGPEDRFVITISFADKNSGATRFVGGSTQNNYLTMWDILRGSGQEVWHQAKEDAFQWFVQVKRGEQPLAPPSETWKFVWH